jgi:hypothetical protein
MTDCSLQYLSLEEAVSLMHSRATIYQQRPYTIAVSVDGTEISEQRRAKVCNRRLNRPLIDLNQSRLNTALIPPLS